MASHGVAHWIGSVYDLGMGLVVIQSMAMCYVVSKLPPDSQQCKRGD